jgi:hypothetical protein
MAKNRDHGSYAQYCPARLSGSLALVTWPPQASPMRGVDFGLQGRGANHQPEISSPLIGLKPPGLWIV